MTAPHVKRVPHAPALPSGLHIDESTESVNILPLSDLHLPHNPEAARRILQSRRFLRRMDMVVLLGDQCGSFGTENEYAAVADFIRLLERPYTAINGNHEFYFETPNDDNGRKGSVYNELDPAGKTAKLDRFREFFGLDSLWRAWHTPLGSFIFLGLDEVTDSKPETLTPKQWRFLIAALGTAPEKPAFVFCHAPIMLDNRLDMIYYDEERTACVEPGETVRAALSSREAEVFWMSGHIHLRPDHYLFGPYLAGRNVWQIHCPDSWGYSRWLREQRVPVRHSELYARYLHIERDKLVLATFNFDTQTEIDRQTIVFARGIVPAPSLSDSTSL